MCYSYNQLTKETNISLLPEPKCSLLLTPSAHHILTIYVFKIHRNINLPSLGQFPTAVVTIFYTCLMSQPYKLHGHSPRFRCPHNTNHHVRIREFLIHNITCPYTNMILRMYIQRFSCALFSSLQFTSLHFISFSRIPTSRCKGFTKSFPSDKFDVHRSRAS